MISQSGNFKLYLASKPVDFRKGMDGLAAIVTNEFELDPFNGAIFIFRSKRADRLKLIVWDGTGLVMTYKRIEGAGFVWPRITDGVITINRSQFEALFEGLDWQRVVPRHTRKPAIV
ncbi:IS66 family insertion sequence element accessory protein TnpB [Cognatiyoonia sp. IB215446]|uniref:IS66 family insertion sequence element accessory protein TnpB n=1 Tax=Cognatiyoonia sp. IB215446 TaxID=3097355 RepID=UPI002A169706|nr:IS66 family insertion sequence element accessory protein TnpB [Cognatiyoonia sp. IB215446]MDX8350672.1 IS66 family insertion sequence element accessory protein TnpB [Cognatiyoonia sp. IB215446]